LRAFQCLVRPLQILLRAFALTLRPLEIVVCALAFGLSPLQLFLRALMISMRPLKILLRSVAIRLRSLQFVLRPLALAVRPLQIIMGRLTIGLRPFPIGMGSFEVGLGALKIRLRPLAFGVRAFEIRLHACALGRDRFFKFTSRVRGRLGRGLFRLASRARDRVVQRPLHFSSCGRHFGLETRSPLRMNRVKLRRPSLLRLSVGALTRLLERLFVALGETAQVGVELGLQFGANGVDDAANGFLGH